VPTVMSRSKLVARQASTIIFFSLDFFDEFDSLDFFFFAVSTLQKDPF